MVWFFFLKLLLLIGSFADLGLAGELPFTPLHTVLWLALFTLSLLSLLLPKNRWAAYYLMLPALLLFYPPAHPLMPLFLPEAIVRAAREESPLPYLAVSLQAIALCLTLRPFTIFMALVAALVTLLNVKYQTAQHAAIDERDKRQEKLLELRQKNRLLQQETANAAELTRLAERDRISRELHDVIGHTLSSSILQLEALNLTTQDEQQKKALTGLRDRLSQGMSDIRQTLHEMRRESFDLTQKVLALGEEMPEQSLDWSMYVTSDLSLNFRLDLLNIIQEGITNFQKYSAADKITIRLVEQRTFYSLEIKDPGPAKKSSGEAPGIGLFAMRETAERYGGLFRVNTDDGFAVYLTFPKSEKNTKE